MNAIKLTHYVNLVVIALATLFLMFYVTFQHYGNVGNFVKSNTM